MAEAAVVVAGRAGGDGEGEAGTEVAGCGGVGGDSGRSDGSCGELGVAGARFIDLVGDTVVAGDDVVAGGGGELEGGERCRSIAASLSLRSSASQRRRLVRFAGGELTDGGEGAVGGGVGEDGCGGDCLEGRVGVF